MKIFNRGNDNKQPAPAPVGPAALAAPAVAPASPAPAPAPPAAPAAPPAPDLTVILDANVKEMSEKIARLASSLETTTSERGSFEAKLEQMEERMRKLSSLTEMISAQYNPFVGDAPAEREAMPKPEIGLAAPMEATLASLPPPPATTIAVALEEPAAPEPRFDAPPAVLESPPQLAAAPEAPSMAAPPAARALVEDVAPGFESSMLLLGWADMLLKSAGTRDALVDLANYYHHIGWVGDAARERLLAYADGLAEPAGGAGRDWRADVEVHEKSLLFVEKLRAIGGRRI